MSKIELKEGIFIEGFNNWLDSADEFLNKHIKRNCDLIYQGKTSDIPEEIANKIFTFHSSFNIPGRVDKFYKNFNFRNDGIGYVCSAKESIQSACSEEYCIIYKTK